MKKGGAGPVVAAALILAALAVVLLRAADSGAGRGLFVSYIDVILQNELSGARRYAAVSPTGMTKEIARFDGDAVRTLAWTEGASGEGATNFTDESGESVTSDELDGLIAALRKKDTQLHAVTVFQDGEALFALADVGIDSWRTHALYQYDREKDELLYLITLPDETILGLRFPGVYPN